MTWNHRIMRHEEDGEIWYAVHEVFYDENDGLPDDAPRPVVNWTTEPVYAQGEDLAGLIVELDQMLQAALAAPGLPVLDFRNGETA